MFRHLPLRARLTALYTALFTTSTAIVLAIAYGLMSGHLHRTLPSRLANPILDRIALQLILILVGTTLLASALGWLAARRALRPIHAVTAAARRVSDERLDERLNLDGPHDEVRELADTFDAMLDRLAVGMSAQQRFVANASHELRTPLTAIRTEVDVTLDDPDADVAELRRMGERVLTGADELNDLLGGLLVLARSQRGIDRRTTVDLTDCVRRAVAAVPATTTIDVTVEGEGGPVEAPSNPTVDIAVEAGSEPLEVPGDEALLRRVVANLVDNAVRYNVDGGWVRVRTDVESRDGRRWATIRVTNSGPRVPSADVERIVEPFERLGRHGAGSGLGLSIVASVAAAHEGTLTIVARDAGGLDVTVAVPMRA